MSQPSFPGSTHRDDPDLGERLRQVFGALVALHRRSAQPVGSEALAREGGVPLSAASIRSALAELEARGLLERAHASSGRIPTGKGWAVYVRSLLVPAVLQPALLEEIDRRLRHSSRDVEQLLGEASRVLSTLTHQLGLALATSLDPEPLHHIELAPLDQTRALLILNLGGDAVRTLALQLESPLDPDVLEDVARVLRERLVGRPLSEVRDRLTADPELVRDSAVRIVARAAMQGWARPLATPLLSAGAMHMAGQPEFASSLQLGPILRVVETGTPLDRLMTASVEGQVAVRVGMDEDRALAACSLVSYVLPGSVRAAVGVLGPLRMDYGLVFAVVDAVGARLADLM
jgi:heat-inducible transcriptional repressor